MRFHFMMKISMICREVCGYFVVSINVLEFKYAHVQGKVIFCLILGEFSISIMIFAFAVRASLNFSMIMCNTYVDCLR